MLARAAAARLERCSCRKLTPTLSSTMAAMTTAERISWASSQDTTASTSSSPFRGVRVLSHSSSSTVDCC